MRHTVIAWMEDKPGVLYRVAGLFRRRNFNIESLTVGHSETPGISRMTFVVNGDERMVDQTVKQLDKLVNVTRVERLDGCPSVIRELALIRVKAVGAVRSEIVQLADIFRGRIVDVALDSMVVEITGPESRVNSLVSLLSHFGIIEMTRTGRVAMVRGSHSTAREEEIALSWNGREVEDAPVEDMKEPS
ncbi:MAG TPA: acetolactate synthase small subunit [Anaerolineae bacterium]|nr:acetolactate synthase small subunit [Anaerolineae bacterium]